MGEMREGPIERHLDLREENRIRTRYYERPVPKWVQLRKWDQGNLASKGFIQSRYDALKDDMLRLTVLTIYVKLWITMLGNLHIWEYIEYEKAIDKAIKPGCLELLIKYPKFTSFKNSLKTSSNFETPSDSEKAWESIEHRFHGALHIKHFEKWPVNKVQFHIDEVGWRGFANKTTKSIWNPRIWIPAIAHGLTYSSYKDPYIARKILLGQGCNPEPLLGIGQRNH